MLIKLWISAILIKTQCSYNSYAHWHTEIYTQKQTPRRIIQLYQYRYKIVVCQYLCNSWKRKSERQSKNWNINIEYQISNIECPQYIDCLTLSNKCLPKCTHNLLFTKRFNTRTIYKNIVSCIYTSICIYTTFVCL